MSQQNQTIEATVTPAPAIFDIEGFRPSLAKLKSIRVGKLHFAVTRLTPDDFKTVNKAKKYSRELGGAGFVSVAQSTEEAKAILRKLREDRS